MHLNTTPATGRIVPAEMRWLRRFVNATTLCCQKAALQVGVGLGWALFGWCLKDEAAALEAEYESQQQRHTLHVNRQA